MRDNSVTISKALAIMLMVMVHARCPIWAQHYISMYHMPLFLFMSGYCFKESHLADTKGFIIKKFKTVYWPFVKWNLVFILLHNLFFYFNIYNVNYPFHGTPSHPYDIAETIEKAFYIIFTMSGCEQLLGGFWFLKALFWGNIIFFAVRKCVHNLGLGGALLVALTIIASAIGRNIPFFSIGYKEIMASLFIWSGYVYHHSSYHFERHWAVILLCAIFVAFGSFFWQGSMLRIEWQIILPYILTALAGTLMTFGISFYAEKVASIKKILIIVGNNTLEILIWHFLAFKIVNLILIIFYHLPITRLAEFPVMDEYAYRGWWVAYLVIGILFPLILTKIVNKVKYLNRM